MSMENVSNHIEEAVVNGQQAAEQLATEAQENIENAVTVTKDKGVKEKLAEAGVIWRPVVVQAGKFVLGALGLYVGYKAVDSYIERNKKESMNDNVIDGEFTEND
ncbi:MAG: hypothetical protein E6X42_08955 [Streptococcus parasanguinis]|nr:hypothetical protein [Streptococcus parasanguinis]